MQRIRRISPAGPTRVNVRHATIALACAVALAACDCEKMLAEPRTGPIPAAGQLESEQAPRPPPPPLQPRAARAEPAPLPVAPPPPPAPLPTFVPAGEAPREIVEGEVQEPAQPSQLPPTMKPMRGVRLPAGIMGSVPRNFPKSLAVPRGADAETKGKQ